MANTNDFLPFAIGAGANVLDQEDYADLPAVTTGFASGVAKSNQVNKALRQSSVIAAMIGKFIAANGVDALDNGDLATLVSAFIDAIKNQTKYDSALQTYDTTPAEEEEAVIYAVDRCQILHWQTIGTFTGYASPLVGLFHWGTTTTPRPFEELLIGSTIDSTLAKYKALIAWANVQGLVVSAASWVAGTYNFGDNGDGTIILPDLRNQFIRATGTDVDTANARALGSKQLDAMQKIVGSAGNIIRRAASPITEGTGSMYLAAGTYNYAAANGSDIASFGLGFDTSRDANNRTSTETRGLNTTLCPMISL